MQELSRKDFLDAYEGIRPSDALILSTIARGKSMRKKRELHSLIYRCGMAAAVFTLLTVVVRLLDITIESAAGGLATASVFSDLSLYLAFGLIFIGACGVFVYLYWRGVHKK